MKEKLNNTVKKFNGSKLIFDFTNLKFINSEGIGYLMEVHSYLMKRDKKLIVVGANSYVKDVFDTIGIDEIITLSPNIDNLFNS